MSTVFTVATATGGTIVRTGLAMIIPLRTDRLFAISTATRFSLGNSFTYRTFGDITFIILVTLIAIDLFTLRASIDAFGT